MTDDSNDYETNARGIIVSPGKFEGEYLYVPYFWAYVLDGHAEDEINDNGTPIAIVLIDDEDVAAFPALNGYHAIALAESGSGFVSGTLFRTEDEIERLRAVCEHDTEALGPDGGDLTTEDDRHYYQYGRLVLERSGTLRGDRTAEWYWYDKTRCQKLGDFGDNCNAAIRAYFDKSQFWPNAWSISDHGNAHLIDLTKD